MIGNASFRRKGLGKEVMKVVESLAKDKLGQSVLVAKINRQNAPSVNFFKKEGFEESGMVEEEVVMKKILK